jgi:F0F1-type ATP synthase membrane subunit a
MESLSVSQENFFSLSFFLLDIFFIYISNIIPFASFPSKTPLSLPPPPAQQPTHSLFLALAIPYTGTYNLHRTKGFSSH